MKKKDRIPSIHFGIWNLRFCLGFGFWDLDFAKPWKVAWLDGVSPYQRAHDDPLVGRRSAEPDLFGI
jgi:hypothetical protein